jgi:anti-anti-sigma factor
MRFSLTRRQRGDRVVNLSPAGELDLCSAGALRAAIQDALRTPHLSAVMVDLGEVTFLDCAGIGALVAGRNAAVRQGRGYSVVNPQWQVRRVLDFTGVLTALLHHPDPAQPTRQAAPSRGPRHRRSGQRVVGAESPATLTEAVSASQPNGSW